MTLPILYSYRRCPYAMRARMALREAGIAVEIREIALRDKPREMLAVSPKGTVPVLVLPDSTVIDESLDIMRWALRQYDPDGWLHDETRSLALIADNDGAFKQALDRYKYADRYPEKPAAASRAMGEIFLQRLEDHLQRQPGLLGPAPSIADVAIFPFVRQFAMVDSGWFAAAPYPALRDWLERWLGSALFLDIMQKHPPWQSQQHQ
jgi:glutathione S-transferase